MGYDRNKRKKRKADPLRSRAAQDAWNRKGGIHDDDKVNPGRDRRRAKQDLKRYYEED